MSERMYLVTGAAGFLGGTICRQLVEKGEKIPRTPWQEMDLALLL